MEMPENCTILPDGYFRTEKIDLQKNRKTAIFVNVFSIGLFVIFFVPLFFLTSVPSLVESVLNDDSVESLVATVSLCGGIIAYLILHELTHGIFMRVFGRTKVKYGLTGLYAYAGSMAYFNKRSYIVTALAPLVIWSAVFVPLTVYAYMCGSVYFHVYYLLAVFNISGSAGDIYMAVRTGRMRKTVLVKDSGTDMEIFDKREA